MIIECRHCFTKFLVDDSEINENGRMVRCSVCEYEWLHIGNVELIKKFIPKKKRNWLFIYFALPIVLLCLILTLQRDIVIQQHQIMVKFYEFFGYHNIKDLQIKINGQITSMNYGENNKIFYYKVPLDFRNNSSDWRYVPAIRIIARDSENKILGEYTHPIRTELRPFSGKKMVLESGFPFSGIHHITVQILNQ